MIVHVANYLTLVFTAMSANAMSPSPIAATRVPKA
jgi:hypothetical protein